MCKYDWTNKSIPKNVMYIATNPSATVPCGYDKKPSKHSDGWSTTDGIKLNGICGYMGEWSNSIEQRPNRFILFIIIICKLLKIYKPN